jgi:hypothetical protein
MMKKSLYLILFRYFMINRILVYNLDKETDARKKHFSVDKDIKRKRVINMEKRKDEWQPTRQAEFEAESEEYITNEEILENIKEAEQSAGMNLESFKKAIASGEIKNYSIVQLRMWEKMERLLKERKQ